VAAPVPRSPGRERACRPCASGVKALAVYGDPASHSWPRGRSPPDRGRSEQIHPAARKSKRIDTVNQPALAGRYLAERFPTIGSKAKGSKCPVSLAQPVGLLHPRSNPTKTLKGRPFGGRCRVAKSNITVRSKSAAGLHRPPGGAGSGVAERPVGRCTSPTASRAMRDCRNALWQATAPVQFAGRNTRVPIAGGSATAHARIGVPRELLERPWRSGAPGQRAEGHGHADPPQSGANHAGGIADHPDYPGRK